MVILGVLVVLGLVAIVRWGGLEVESPPREGEPGAVPSAREAARRYVWHFAVAVVAGLGAGVLVAGAGGRLAMRLLAATAGDDAQGRLTEADEVVGRITTDGTIGFVIFTALFFGVATGLLYLLIRRWLPGGRLGGLTFGALLLVVAATTVEPLRSGNPDFDLVGPGWLSLVVFSALVLAHGMLVAAIAGRYSRALPLLTRQGRSIAAHAPVLLVAPFASALIVVAVVGALVVLARSLGERIRSRPVTVAGRVILAAVALVSLPGFLASVVDIARG